HLGGERAEALEGAAEQQHRGARVAGPAGVGLVVQAPRAELEHLRRAGQELGAVVCAVEHGGTSPLAASCSGKVNSRGGFVYPTFGRPGRVGVTVTAGVALACDRGRYPGGVRNALSTICPAP